MYRNTELVSPIQLKLVLFNGKWGQDESEGVSEGKKKLSVEIVRDIKAIL